MSSMSSATAESSKVISALRQERCPSCGEMAARIAECVECAAKMCEGCSASKARCEVCDVNRADEFEGCYAKARQAKDSNNSRRKEAAGASYNGVSDCPPMTRGAV